MRVEQGYFTKVNVPMILLPFRDHRGAVLRMERTIFATLCLMIMIVGCTDETRVTEAKKTEDANESLSDRVPQVTETRVSGKTVTFRIVQKGRGVWLANIGTRVIGGDVYLDPLYISSPVHETVFKVDLSGPEIPADWQERLYWIEKELLPPPLTSGNRARTIERRKVEL